MGATLGRMERLGSVWSPADAFAPLAAACGDRLTVCREGDVVRWSYDGRMVVVALRNDGSAEAAFVDRPLHDAVSAAPAVPVYRRAVNADYTLDQSGCVRMVADMEAFFGGTREPRFAFSAAYEVPPAS
jgi:hypothetical protein